MTKRSIVTVILLSILTCGIYSIYWFYVTAIELNDADNSEDQLMNYLLAILLGIVTCGIYEIYWLIKFFKKMDVVTGKDNFILYVLLTIFTGGLISMAIAQDSMNHLS